MTAASAAPDRPVDEAGEQGMRRLWHGAITFIVYLLTGGLYGVWWFFVTRREMHAEDPDTGSTPPIALLEGIGSLIPVVNAFVWYRTLTDINKLREKVRAPRVGVLAWVAALAASIPCIYLVPEILGPLTDQFNPDVREIIRAVGYALFPAQFLVFGYAVGYWNEYWMEKSDERADWRRFGPVDFVFMALAAAVAIGLIIAAIGAL